MNEFGHWLRQLPPYNSIMKQKPSPQDYYDLIGITVRDMMREGNTVRSDAGDEALRRFAYLLREALDLPHPPTRDLRALFTNAQASMRAEGEHSRSSSLDHMQQSGTDGRQSDWQWHTDLSRNGSEGGIDYLCARQTSRGVELAVCGHEWLGEVPSDWFDEEGEPLPEHQDAEGDLLVPTYWEGKTVTGVEDRVFVGELVADDERTTLIDSDLADGTAQALTEVGWDEADLEQLESLIRTLRQA